MQDLVTRQECRLARAAGCDIYSGSLPTLPSTQSRFKSRSRSPTAALATGCPTNPGPHSTMLDGVAPTAGRTNHANEPRIGQRQASDMTVCCQSCNRPRELRDEWSSCPPHRASDLLLPVPGVLRCRSEAGGSDAGKWSHSKRCEHVFFLLASFFCWLPISL